MRASSIPAVVATVALAVVACTGPGSALPPTGGGDAPAAPDPAPQPAPDRGQRIERPQGKTNVLIVVLDDVGVEHVRAYGADHQPPPTPTLDKLAQGGVRFDHAWSNPVCSPTRASIMTGRHARRHGIGQIIDSWKDEWDLADDEVTLPEMLGKGWDSSQVGKWHLSSARGDAARAPGKQGFGWWAGSLGNLRDKVGDRKGEEWGYFAYMKNTRGKLDEVRKYVTTDTADDAVARIREMQEPWMMYLAFNGAHYPTHVPPAELVDRKGLRDDSPEPDLYDAQLTALDKELGRVLDAMPPEKRARTTVIVVGDNGSPDYAIRPPFDPERAKGSVYELGVHVPLIVTGPFVAEPGRSTGALVHTVDIFATVADIGRVDLASLANPVDGVSFLPVLLDPQAAPPRDTVYTEKFLPNGLGAKDRDTVAIRNAEYKLVVDHKARKGEVVEQLFQVGDDLDEKRNLLRDGTPINDDAARAYKALKAALEAQQAEFRRERRGG